LEIYGLSKILIVVRNLIRNGIMARRLSLLFLALAWAAPALAGEYWQGVARTVSAGVEQAEASFAKGDGDGAKRLINDTYFQKYEESRLEGAVRKEISAKRAAEVEKMFADLRKAVTAKDATGVKSTAAGLKAALAADAKTLDAANVSPDVYQVNQ
jgi:high-affinity iron transporter